VLLLGTLVLSVSICQPRILVNRYLQYVGAVSFSVYLLHNLIIDLLEATVVHLHSGSARLVVLYVLTTAGVLLVASLTYRFIEQPMIMLGRHLITPKPRIAPPRARPAQPR
jgi:peptidoglycan/LPS O-acetylase OafA/YrhL